MTDLNALFDELDAPTAKAEGGYVFNKDDAGGETNHGIIIATARENGFKGRMIDMTAAEAKAIRKSKYFIRSGIYLLAKLNEAVAREVYDAGILSGPGTAVMWLQRALNVFNRGGRDYADIDVDGGIGPATVNALSFFLVRNGTPGIPRLLKALNSLQGEFFISVGETRPKNETFENGWFDQRID